MAPKILLLHITADSSLLERECAAQEFIAATDAVFFKAQGLAMLVPLHEIAFSLLEGLLDNWCLLNLNSVEWPCKSEVCQVCVNLWSLNKQMPWATEFGKMVQVSWEHAISTIEQIKLMHFEKMVIELKSTALIMVPKPVMNPAPIPVSATSSIQHVPSVPYIANPSSPPMHLLSELLLHEQEVTMDVDSAKRPEETWPVALTKTLVTEVKAPAPVLLTKPKRTPFFKLYCTDEHVPFLPSGL
ncbi:hypothetical protein C0995_005318 [Termitomyces sp. Mi166|nr:hypothetical protein C0995_005318 [Termitomyces sp. Mi166\